MPRNHDRVLTPRQQTFVDAYLADPTHNATNAALAAGYAKKYVDSRATRTLALPIVQAAIAKRLRELNRRYRLSQERVVRELATVAFSDVRDFVVGERGELTTRDGVSDRSTRAVSSVKHKTRTRTDSDGETTVEHEVEYRMWDKVQALGLAMKHLGLIKPDAAPTVNVQINMQATVQRIVTVLQPVLAQHPELQEEIAAALLTDGAE